MAGAEKVEYKRCSRYGVQKVLRRCRVVGGQKVSAQKVATVKRCQKVQKVKGVGGEKVWTGYGK